MKRKFSKLLALLMCMAMFVSLLPAAYAEETPAAVADAGGDEAGVQEPPLETAPENGETAPVAEDEVSPVEVEFICTPEELSLSVYAKADEAHENLIEPQEDGKYLLLPGLYIYTAVCEGYVTAEDVEFEVDFANKRAVEIVLTPILYSPSENSSVAPDCDNLYSSYTLATIYYANGKAIPNSSCPADGTNPYCSCGIALGNSGHWCCWNYASGAYQYIWNIGFSRYSSNLVSNLSASERTMTVEHLRAYLSQTAAGAVLRIDGDSVATNGDNNGHSLIFLAMNSTGDGAIFLEGNYNNRGNSRIYEWKFNDLISTYPNYKYIKYIIWPYAPSYQSTYTLTFDANGGTCATTSLEVQNGETLGSRYPTPTRDGYRFLGWFYSKTVSDGVGADTPITQSMTLYAHWSGTQNPGIKIDFNACGGTLPGASISRTVDAVNTGRGEGWLCIFDFPGEIVETNRWGAEVAVNKNGTTGAKRGWSSEDKLTVPDGGFVLSGHKNDTEDDGCVFVERIWDSPYISFNYSTMVVSAYNSLDAYLNENKYVETGQFYGDLPTPTRDGYIFDGWYTAETGGTRIIYTTYVTVTSEQTLYAHWSKTQKPEIKINFNANGGTLPGASMSRTVDAVNAGRGEGQLCIFNSPGEIVETNCWGAEVAVNRNGIPIKKRGWSNEDKLTVPEDGFVLSGHKNYTEADACTFVEWIWDGPYIGFNYTTMVVSVYDSLNAYLTENKYVETGYPYGDLPTPTRDDYIFGGWYTSATGGTQVRYDTNVSVTSEQTLYAHWRKIAPTLTGIKMSAPPAKTVYALGDALDTTGLTLEASYDDGTTELVTSGFTVSGFDSNTAGIKTVTVSYEGKTTSFTVTVRAAVSETDPQIIIESKRAAAGESINVTISLKNNPGIASLKLKVKYDPSLTLTEVVYNTDIGGQFQQPQRLSNPVTLNWYNGAANSEGDWLYATLTFVVSDHADGGSTAVISATYNPDDVYDITETNIPFAVIDGIITVIEYIPGDINGDGEVNNKDITRLFQYLSDWDVSVNERALDVNGDGDINNKDLTRLFQYLSDWDVEIY